MKKTKLIVPAALAVMLLSTAASVTGTVAWFTANRKVDIQATEFEVTTTDGNLTVEASSLANCTVDNSSTIKSITVARYDSNGDSEVDTDDDFIKLTDASVNVATGLVYDHGDVFDANGIPSSYESIASPYGARETDNVYLCVSWTLTFTYEFVNSEPGSQISLFFDVETSKLYQSTNDSSDLETGRGFRIGLSSSANKIVFADEELAKNCNYVVSTSAMKDEAGTKPVYYVTTEENIANKATVEHPAGTVYSDANYSAYTLASAGALASGTDTWLVDKSVGYTGSTTHASTNTPAMDIVSSFNLFDKAENDETGHSARGDYLGSFVKGGTVQANTWTQKDTIVVTCYAWFEGTDPYVVNASDLNVMLASLSFYTRRASETAAPDSANP